MNFAQGLVLRMRHERQGEVTVAADDAQAVDRPGCAGDKNLRDFQREHPAATVVTLEHGHRSRRRLVQVASSVIAGSPCERVEKRVRARGGGRVRFWHCRSERAEAQQVAADI